MLEFLYNGYGIYIILCLFFYLSSELTMFCFSKGEHTRSNFVRIRRFLFGAILAILPSAVALLPLNSMGFIVPCIIGCCWMLTYPALYYLTHHKGASEFQFYFEAVFATYLIGWLSCLYIFFVNFAQLHFIGAILLTVIEIIFWVIVVVQVAYYMQYGTNFDETTMQLIQETNYNEIIEYFKSISILKNVAVIFFIVGSTWSIYCCNSYAYEDKINLSIMQCCILLILSALLTFYLWKEKDGMFVRTEIVKLYQTVRNYRLQNLQYLENKKEHLLKLQVERLGRANDKPGTIILVIGESASREYMKAFNDEYEYNTTPWLYQNIDNSNFLIFNNTFSCFGSTVPALSRALTEFNQYDDNKFLDSCSIVDIAHKLDYKVWWYSNQGHLGANDTPITLVAETADVAKWTRQELNKIQYDEELINYLGEVDVRQNNFVVLHLKGSHFTYLNRFPKEFTRFSETGVLNLELNYADSIAYTDFVLQEVFEYAKQHLNLQTMIYFSDHGAVPDKPRSPNMNCITHFKVPLWIYFSDEYIHNNQAVYETLSANKNKYWTNDLAYELICGILNIKSNRYNPDNSLASPTYKFEKEELLINGDRRIWE